MGLISSIPWNVLMFDRSLKNPSLIDFVVFIVLIVVSSLLICKYEHINVFKWNVWCMTFTFYRHKISANAIKFSDSLNKRTSRLSKSWIFAFMWRCCIANLSYTKASFEVSLINLGLLFCPASSFPFSFFLIWNIHSCSIKEMWILWDK